MNDVTINADHNKLTQVIRNIITNAIKYTPDGYVKVTAIYIPEKINADNSSVGIVKIAFQDTGNGITKASS